MLWAERRTITSFNRVVFMLLYAVVFHGICIVLNIGVPVGLLYGPLVMAAYFSQTEKETAQRVINQVHFFPFYFFSLFYIVLCATELFFSEVSGILSRYYYTAYLFLMPLSLLRYAIDLLVRRINQQFEFYKLSDRLLDMLIFLCLGAVFPLAVFAVNQLIGLDWQWERLVAYGILCFGLAVIAHYLFVKRVLKQDFHELIGPIIETCVDLQQTVHAPREKRLEAERICEYIRKEQLFLKPDLSLDMVADEVGIPKYVCSKLLNEEIGKSFYQLLSEYRIDHAAKLMESDKGKRYTIEWIAYTSGFGCKTSFYRYFKNYKGCMPSEYQRQRGNE